MKNSLANDTDPCGKALAVPGESNASSIVCQPGTVCVSGLCSGKRCVLGVGARLWAQLKLERPKLVNPAEVRCRSDVPSSCSELKVITAVAPAVSIFRLSPLA